MKKTKEAPEDEMILAELIAVASSHGLTGCKHSSFENKKRAVVTYCTNTPPKGIVRCCVLGAQMLSGRNFGLGLVAARGNDAGTFEKVPFNYCSKNDIRQLNIGAAFNIAMEE